MPDLKLSSKEKNRIELLIRNVQKLSDLKRPTDVQRFIKRQRLRAILVMLGRRKPERVLQAKALDIILDGWPFKIYRLRKLIKTWTTKAVNANT